MNEEFLINCTPQETRVALMQQGAVQELHVERTGGRGIVGNIYLGRVVRVLPGMQSAFIEAGLARTAFLHVADIWGEKNGDKGTMRPIEPLITEGETLMVQVLKDPIGTKGARLSTQISIAGRHLVFLPQDDHIGVSQKIPAEQRDALRQTVQALVGPAGGGFILRTNAEDSSDEELLDDIAYLRKTWARIKEASLRLPPTSTTMLCRGGSTGASSGAVSDPVHGSMSLRNSVSIQRV
jgi:ribonuclease G